VADLHAETEPQLGGTRRAPYVPRESAWMRRIVVVDSASAAARTRWPACPVVVAGGRDVQEPAGHRDGNPGHGELLDSRIVLIGRQAPGLRPLSFMSPEV
jgi:hypothetical protein